MTELENDPLVLAAVSSILGGNKPPVDPANPEGTPEGGAAADQGSGLEQKADGGGDKPAEGATEQKPDPNANPDATPTSDLGTETDFFKKHFGILGFTDVEQAKAAITERHTLVNTLDQAKAEIEKLKASPQFADENDRRVFEWTKQYRTLDERAFIEHKMLDKIDPEAIEGKLAMRLDYILSKKSLSHEDAGKRFEYDYKKLYEPDELASDEDRDIIRIGRLEAEAQAKENLKNLKANFGTVASQPESAEQKAATMALDRAVGDSVANWDTAILSAKEFTFSDGAVKYPIEVGDQERQTINQVIRPILENKANYDSDGKLKYDINYIYDREMKITLFDKIVEKLKNDVTNKAKDEAFRTITNRQTEGDKPVGATSATEVTTQGNMADSIMKHIK